MRIEHVSIARMVAIARVPGSKDRWGYRLRVWNINHGLVITWAIWVAVFLVFFYGTIWAVT